MFIWISVGVLVGIVPLIMLIESLIEFIKKICYNPHHNYTAYFKDKDNRLILYHGVNISNFQKHSEDNMPWHGDEDIAKLKEWGFNLVRFLVFWEKLESKEGHYNYDYLNNIENFIKKLRDADIDVLIDIHQDLYSQKFGGNGFPEWTVNDDGHKFTRREPWNLNYKEPAVKAVYKNFWKSKELNAKYIDIVGLLQNKFKTYDNVIGIDVMNEPFFPLLNIFNFEKKIF